jgi:hypothetical protein
LKSLPAQMLLLAVAPDTAQVGINLDISNPINWSGRRDHIPEEFRLLFVTSVRAR